MNRQCKEIQKNLDQLDGSLSQGFCGPISKGTGEKHAGTGTFLHVKLAL